MLHAYITKDGNSKLPQDDNSRWRWSEIKVNQLNNKTKNEMRSAIFGTLMDVNLTQIKS